jgi:soluble lytic murein transglycosylase-like protein
MFVHLRHVFALVILFLTVASLHAQTANDQSRQLPPTDSTEKFREDFIKASEEYRASLQQLMVQYESNLKNLTERSAKSKELYDEGLVSRREYEKTLCGIAEAQAKVNEVGKEIMNTEITIAEARHQPHLNDLPDSELEFPSQGASPWTTGNAGIDTLIRQNAAHYGVDAYLIYCVIKHESDFSPTALSVKGARGLMQLMPGTAARYGVIDVNDPAQNIMGGTRYLKDLLRLFPGRIDLVLAAYNAGEGAVIKYGQTVPPYKETKDYVRLISLRYLRRARASKPTEKPLPQP